MALRRAVEVEQELDGHGLLHAGRMRLQGGADELRRGEGEGHRGRRQEFLAQGLGRQPASQVCVPHVSLQRHGEGGDGGDMGGVGDEDGRCSSPASLLMARCADSCIQKITDNIARFS